MGLNGGLKRRLFVHNDAGIIDTSGSESEIRGYLEPLRDSDVARIYWEGGTGDVAKRFSNIARDASHELLDAHGGETGAFFSHAHSRLWAKSWLAYHRRGVDPFRGKRQIEVE